MHPAERFGGQQWESVTVTSVPLAIGDYATSIASDRPYDLYPSSSPQPSGFNDAPVANAETQTILSSEELEAKMEMGEVIPIANGFAFVPDYRPAGKEADYIPAPEYTAYFKRRQVPYAVIGPHASHDRKHGRLQSISNRTIPNKDTAGAPVD